MAINIGTNFSYHGKLPNFDRDKFKTKAAMMAFDENSIDEGHLSYCEEDGNIYQYKSANAVDATTGKWRIFKTDVDVDAVLNGTSKNPIQNKAVFEALKAKADAVALDKYQPKYKADYVATKDFNYSELPDGAEVVDLNGYTMNIDKVGNVEGSFYNGNIRVNADNVTFNSNNVFTNLVNVDIRGYKYSKNDYEITYATLYNCKIYYAEIKELSALYFCDIISSTILAPKIYYSELTDCKVYNGENTGYYNVTIDGIVYKNPFFKNLTAQERGYESNIDKPFTPGNAPSCEAVKTKLENYATKTELNGKADASALNNYTTTATTDAISADVSSLMNEVFVLTASASVTPNIAEAGTSKAVNVSVDAKLGKGRTQVDEITIDGTKYTGTIPYTHSATATTTHTYNITVKKGTKTANASATINFYNASYYGVVDASKTSLTGTEVKALKTKEIKSGRSGTRSFNLDNQKACIAYPQSFGAAASIKDANGFDYLASYTRSDVTIDSVVYYVYLMSNATTVNNFKQIIN